MARIQLLKTLVNQRLTAAAEEIFGVFERTLTQYEEEIHRQREMLELVLNPDIGRADPPQLLVCEEEVPPEQQERSPYLGQEERSPSLGQEEPEPLQIKEEQEELWTSQEGGQLQGLEEADIIDLTSTPVPVKSEHDEEKPQSSWFNQNQTEETREAEPLASTSTEQMKTEPDGEDCGLSEPASNLDPAGDLEPTRYGQFLSSHYSGTETEDSDYGWKPQSGSNTLKSKKTQRVPEKVQLLLHMRPRTEENPSGCTVGGKTFGLKAPLQIHMRTHAGARPFSCSTGFRQKTQNVEDQSSSTSNMFNTSMEPSHELRSANHIPSVLSCKVCGRTFPSKMPFMLHIRVHLNGCGLCGKHLEPTESLKVHLQDHRTCKICGKTFNRMFHFVLHTRTHTGEKPFSCTVCGRRFRQKVHLKLHMRTHTREHFQLQTL